MDSTFVSERERVLAIAAATLCVAVVGMGLSLSIPLLSIEMERMGVGGTLIGLNTATAGFASIIAAPFIPRLAARFGVAALLGGSVVTVAFSLMAFKLFFDVFAWFPIRLVFATGLGILFVLSEYWINAAAPPARRGLVMGIYASVLAIGFALGPLVLAVSGTEGWAPYLTGAALFLLAGGPLVLARGLTPAIDHATTRPVLSFLLAAPAATGAALAFGALETGGFSLLPVWGLRIGLDSADAAFLVTLFAGGSLLFQIPMGMISDRVDRRMMLLVVAIIGATGALLLPVAAGSSILLGVLLVVWGGTITSLYTVGLAHLGARFKGGDLASANAAFFMVYNVGLIVGPPAVGIGLEHVAPPHGFAYAMAGFCLAYIGVVLVSIGRARGAVRSHS